MEKYFSSALCRSGYCSAYNAIYKKDASSQVFIINGGDDFERAVFFRRLEKNLRGYSISLFNPFYDESPDGIFIKNLNTYILSDGGYNRISPVLSGEWEKYIEISKSKGYPLALRREILNEKAIENSCYRKACEFLKSAGEAKEKIHAEVSPFLDDEKMINFLRRFCPRTFRDISRGGGGTVRLLSSPTPLGLHTHWDTVFSSCETLISISDETSFISAVMLGIIKDYAQNEKVPFIMSPSHYTGEIPQFLIFPTLSTAVIAEDTSHAPPFRSSTAVGASRFLSGDLPSDKIKALSEIEGRLIDSCIASLYEGREHRFGYNDLIKNYSDLDAAEKSADKLAQRLLS